MWKLSLGAALTVALLACGGSTIGGIEPPEAKPTTSVVVRPPAAGLEITATMIAASLGDDCGASSMTAGDAPSGGACAPLPDGGASSCTGHFVCQQSNMQLSFEAEGAGGPATVKIVSVRLLEVGTDKEVDALTARDPQAWDGTKYRAWDETLASGDEKRASYKLSAPRWNGWNSYRSRYVIEVVLTLDGVRRTLRSSELAREPEVAT